MPKVGILLGTLNGARFLPQQLTSIERQTFADWRLFVSDDGSTDGTLNILKALQEKLGADRVGIRCGPQSGFVANFLSLACDAAIRCDAYAFADQDDVWEDDKLARALQHLAGVPAEMPAVYCSRTRLIDDEGHEFGFSPLFKLATSFRNALVQNIAGANTMVFNEPARQLLIKAGADVDVLAHDWWLYMLTTAAGGRVIYDPHPTVRYRIHGENLIGSNIGWYNRCLRLVLLLRGRFRQWTDRNVAALARIVPFMTAENREIFELFCRSRSEPLLRRALGIMRSGVYRQTALGNLGLLLAALTRRI